jgi:hypothetical protein
MIGVNTLLKTSSSLILKRLGLSKLRQLNKLGQINNVMNSKIQYSFSST